MLWILQHLLFAYREWVDPGDSWLLERGGAGQQGTGEFE